MGAGTGTGTTKGVFGDTRAADDRERRGVADGCACVPEILTAPELEHLFAGVMGPELLEPAFGAAVGEDVEEAQELAVDAAGGTHHARQKGIGDRHPAFQIIPNGVRLWPPEVLSAGLCRQVSYKGMGGSGRRRRRCLLPSGNWRGKNNALSGYDGTDQP